jgi:hypothetical protein
MSASREEYSGRQGSSTNGESAGQSQFSKTGPGGYPGWNPADPVDTLAPTDEEVNAWAEQEHQRRQAWLEGPSEEEKQEWRRREIGRRLARAAHDGDFGPEWQPEYAAHDDRRRLSRRYARDAQLATEGLGLLLATLPFRMLAELVNAGREWEEDYPSSKRRRVPLYDDDR